MALRIIRKSASQSQVEVIRGTGDQKPELSILCFFDSAEQIQACKDLLKSSDWLRQTAELILMKSTQLSEPLRKAFEAQEHTIKLVNEPKEASWSLRLRTLIQEASTDICVFLPHIPAQLNAETIQALHTHLEQQPLTGLVAPSLASGEQIWAAGQDFFNVAQTHHLSAADWQREYETQAGELLYFYRDLPLSLWSHQSPLQSAAVPLLCCGIRRSAYLSLNWKDSDYALPWLAQELAYLMRREQYQLDVLSTALVLEEQELSLLEAPLPADFVDKWSANVRNLLPQLYDAHGWTAQGSQSWQRTTQDTEVA